jgi:hypothetical protein
MVAHKIISDVSSRRRNTAGRGPGVAIMTSFRMHPNTPRGPRGRRPREATLDNLRFWGPNWPNSQSGPSKKDSVSLSAHSPTFETSRYVCKFEFHVAIPCLATVRSILLIIGGSHQRETGWGEGWGVWGGLGLAGGEGLG